MRVKKGGMVELVVLLMPQCSRECLVMQDYDSIEAKYFERNSRVQWSEWHEWRNNHKGKRIDPDRWRLWRMWEENHCSAYVEQLRNTLWVQTVLRKMLCPPKPFDLFSAPVPESSDQLPGFHHKKTPASKKGARPKLTVTPMLQAEERPKANAKAKESSSSPNPWRRMPSEV